MCVCMCSVCSETYGNTVLSTSHPNRVYNRHPEAADFQYLCSTVSNSKFILKFIDQTKVAHRKTGWATESERMCRYVLRRRKYHTLSPRKSSKRMNAERAKARRVVRGSTFCARLLSSQGDKRAARWTTRRHAAATNCQG
jgi:hypothetical protein